MNALVVSFFTIIFQVIIWAFNLIVRVIINILLAMIIMINLNGRKNAIVNLDFSAYVYANIIEWQATQVHVQIRFLFFFVILCSY